MAIEKKKVWERRVGVLMPISSLPGPYGIGSMGKEAFAFLDMAREMEFSYWQVLPVGPTGYGDSPYQSFSAFAGNPYFIDLPTLIEEGILTEQDCNEINWGDCEDEVDYGALYFGRNTILHKAFHNSRHKELPEYVSFCKKSADWLDDYALFMAIKDSVSGKPWQEWELLLRRHDPEALKKAEEELSEEVDYYRFCQFKFDEQWKRLRAYAKKKGIEIIGDIPLYMAMDSADVWANYELFELDEKRREINIAGVPPDLFSATGQRWGNPLYRWDVMEKDHFSWWRKRMELSASRYDIIRIDHFIGIVNFYSIPAESETAMVGEWRKGPGEKLTRVINEAVGDGKIIAEDLGVLTQPVIDLINKNEYPGMKVYEFSLDCSEKNPYLPHNFTSVNSIAYIGTHDNETLHGTILGKSDWDIGRIREYFGIGRQESVEEALIREAYRCLLHTTVIQMQDILGLGNEARMNFPSTLGNNWKWRMRKDQLRQVNIGYYQRLAQLYSRRNTTPIETEEADIEAKNSQEK